MILGKINPLPAAWAREPDLKPKRRGDSGEVTGSLAGAYFDGSRTCGRNSIAYGSDTGDTDYLGWMTLPRCLSGCVVGAVATPPVSSGLGTDGDVAMTVDVAR